MKKFIAALAISATLFACGGGENNDAMDENTTPETSAREEATETNEVVLELGGTDEMKYTKAEMTVPAGAEVTLNFKHEGKMSVEAMGHNFVLLAQGTDLVAFASDAMMQKDNGYLPADMSSVLAHTNMIGGGESTSITFTAPTEPGEYQYVCTFPGHYGSMQGKLIVQ
ncbi:MAG: hypothetical protein Kapaf2KO_18980 [Candidatus Kapaibacteriales bacterium]